MFHYNIFIVLAIVANVLTNPIVNPPAHRCCPPDRYSYKIDHSYQYKYFDGTNSTVHVSLFDENLLINNLCSLEIVFDRYNLLMLMMLNVDFS